MKHTSGPWLADFSIVNGHIGISIKDSRGYQLATVYLNSYRAPNRPGGEINQPENVESKANARLISAAPDLLKALKILHPQKDVWRTPTDEQAIFIEQAISKAEGNE